MRRLFQTASLSRKHRLLWCLTIIAMILLTFASQLEIVALGIITRKGPDFFELFAPVEDGKLQKNQEVDWNDVFRHGGRSWTRKDRQSDTKAIPPFSFGIKGAISLKK